MIKHPPEGIGVTTAIETGAGGGGSFHRRLRWMLAGVLLWIAPVVRGDEVVVAVSRSYSPSTALSRTTLAAIFGMRMTTWPDGTPIHVFVLKDDDPLHVAFCKQILHVFPHQMRAAWDRLVFSGSGQAPEPVDTPDEMRQRVAESRGGIGYLNKDLINDKLAIVPVR